VKAVLFDINVLLDIFLERQGFYPASSASFGLAETGAVRGMISAAGFTALFYLLRRAIGREKAVKLLEKLKTVLKIAALNQKVIELSLVSDIKDFEDAVQYYSASAAGADFILTRNKKDYSKAPGGLNILTPEEFISMRKGRK